MAWAVQSEETVRIVFMGTTQFGISALAGLKAAGHDIAAVVSTPASPKGRGRGLVDSPMALYAKSAGLLPLLTPQSLNDERFMEELKTFNADVFVVAAFRILPKAVFSIPPLGTYNIHASILPKYRGSAPIQRAVAAGETETGVTIFRIDTGIDTGRIVLAQKTAIGPEETAEQLAERLSVLGAESLPQALERVASGADILETQNPALACGAPKLTKAEGRIDWQKSARDIFNEIRAFKPFPGTYTFLDDTRISLEWGVPAAQGAGSDAVPGTVVTLDKEGFTVQCGEGAVAVTMVKPGGGTVMTARDFVNGHGIVAGARFA